MPLVAERLKRPLIRPEHPEVLSSIGAAVSLVRAEVTRNGTSNGAAVELAREAERACVASGAAPATVSVETAFDAREGVLRAVATGAVALEAGAADREPAGDEARLQAAAQALGLEPEALQLVAETGFYRVYSENGSGRVAAIDGLGAVALAEDARRVVAASGDELVEQLRREVRGGHTQPRRRHAPAPSLARLRLADPRPLRRAASRGRRARGRTHARGPHRHRSRTSSHVDVALQGSAVGAPPTLARRGRSRCSCVAAVAGVVLATSGGEPSQEEQLESLQDDVQPALAALELIPIHYESPNPTTHAAAADQLEVARETIASVEDELRALDPARTRRVLADLAELELLVRTTDRDRSRRAADERDDRGSARHSCG